ncbi:hypothetical protein WME95_25530 [Sorangium sp. So ce327]|jgi:hypothetical protein|uniref:hypothetical protein n=1 Tax=unclassified Sorangium TaxID=2621164 RepID=UPI003F5E0D8A
MAIEWRAAALGIVVSSMLACAAELETPEHEETGSVASAAEQSCGGCATFGNSVRCGTSLVGSSKIIVENGGSIDARARLIFSYGFSDREIDVPVGRPYRQRRSFHGTDVIMTNLTPGSTLCMHH